MSFAADVAYLRMVRAVIHEMFAPATSDPAELHQIVQATDEAVTNAVVHAYGSDRKGRVSVTCDLDGGRTEVRVSDQGKTLALPGRNGFDLSEYMEREEPGGLGLHLIGLIADSVEYGSEGGRNTLVLRRALRSAQDEGSRR